jgi:hypothetical protein
LTLTHYAHFFGTSLYAHVLFTTLRISLATTLAAALLGYPVALVMARANPMLSRAVTLIVIAPLVVSVVVRTYGWQLILANGPQGLLNWTLLSLGVIRTPLRLLYSETAVVLGSLHVFLPMMVLPLAAALGKIDPRLDDAARMLGAGALRICLSLGNSERRARERIRTSEGIRTVSKPPLLDLREIDDETSAFAPAGFCPWCDSRRSWVGRAFRRLKKTVAPQRRAKREALSPRR